MKLLASLAASRSLQVVLIFSIFSTGYTQTKEQAKRKAQSELQKRTPEQIEEKIKELGMTRKEAETRANDLGIDLDTYLQQRDKPSVLPEPSQAAPTEILQVEEAKKGVIEAVEPEQPPPTGPKGLPYFGYAIFSRVPSGFEPTAVGPVDPEYLIGPEDILRVTVWGQVEFQNELGVDRVG